MIRLKIPLIPNENILQCLFEKNICTVNDFLQKKSSDLQKICNLSCKEVTQLKDNIIVICSSPFINGYEIYFNKLSTNYLQTGIINLDSLLGGGLFASKIYEICGPSACGKTQLSFSILLNIIITTKRDILYIDTKNKFSVNRIKQILKTKYLMTDIEIYAILKKIKIYSIFNIYSLITCLHDLKVKPEPVIIIDSLPVPYLSFIGFYENDGLCYMNHICSILKYICKNDATILITNLALKNCDFATKINEDLLYHQHKGKIDLKPAIGKYWFHVPNTRLMLTTILNKQKNIHIHNIKSVYIPINEKCILSIDDKGVS